MVTENHYRWDFIGLSTDEKPTPATSEKVVDGSTYYTSDDSKLYVFCKDQWYEKIPIGGGGGGGGDEKPLKDINFYDYDGTIVESWTLEELADKTELPENPEHEGLTAEGWNWSLSDLKANALPQDVGQIYRPTDGKTHLIIENTSQFLNPVLGLGVNGTATIDWGDNTAPTVLTGSNIDTMQDASHTYASAGTYDVSIELAEGTTGKIRADTTFNQLWKAVNGEPNMSKQNRAYYYQVKAIYLGSGWSKLWLCNTLGLKYVTLPSSLTFLSDNLFINCNSLLHVNIPNSITTWGNYLFRYDRWLRSVSLPNKNLNTNSVGTNMFDNCSGLTRLTIPRVWTRVPSSLCYYCSGLRDFTFHSGLTSLGGSCFYQCISLGSSIKLPNTITQINQQALGDTASLVIIDISDATAVPTGGSAMFGIPNATSFVGFQILVPEALESDFKTTSQWSTYADYIVGV